MKTYVATENLGKLAEMQAMFAGSEIELATYPGYRAVEESSDTYAGNALLKARALHAQLVADGIDAWVLADDSGLEIDALGGRPGVLSARYGGPEATWPVRRAGILSELCGVAETSRGARFVAHIVLVRAEVEPLSASGVVDGRIATSECGSGGFGYDPIFFFAPAGCTFAELSDAEKNRVSHRYHAVTDVLAKLRGGA